LTFCLKLIFLDSDGEIVSESEYEQSEDEIFRNAIIFFNQGMNIPKF
jgi:hypothetical protein